MRWAEVMGVRKKHWALSITLVKTQQLQKMGHLWQTDFKIINISIILYITKAQQVLGICQTLSIIPFTLCHMYIFQMSSHHDHSHNTVVMVTMKRHTDWLSIFALCWAEPKVYCETNSCLWLHQASCSRLLPVSMLSYAKPPSDSTNKLYLVAVQCSTQDNWILQNMTVLFQGQRLCGCVGLEATFWCFWEKSTRLSHTSLGGYGVRRQ